MAPKTAKPWDRGTNEPSKWYGRFIYYLEQGSERTLELAHSLWWDSTNASIHRKRGKPKRPPITWYEAAREWKWKARAAAWDDNNQAAVLQEAARAQEDMIRRHLKIALSLIQLGVVNLQDMMNAKDKDGQPKRVLSAREAAAYIDQGIKLERQARGFPPESIGVYTLTDEELIKKYAEYIGSLEAAGSLGSGDEEAWPTSSPDDTEEPGIEEVPEDLS